MSPGISLSLIVKNEERALPICLGSAADLVHEIILIDTGSTDRTKEVAASFGARVFDFAWRDDFAAARNESLRHATGDWIFWVDADDRLDEENRQKLRNLFAGLKDENAAYVMKSRSGEWRGASGERREGISAEGRGQGSEGRGEEGGQSGEGRDRASALKGRSHFPEGAARREVSRRIERSSQCCSRAGGPSGVA